jgi:hypothetical protein
LLFKRISSSIVFSLCLLATSCRFDGESTPPANQSDAAVVFSVSDQFVELAEPLTIALKGKLPDGSELKLTDLESIQIVVSDPSILSVSRLSSGEFRVEGKKEGSTEVQLSSENKQGKFLVGVKKRKLVGVRIVRSPNSSVAMGLTSHAALLASYDDGLEKDVTKSANWSVSSATASVSDTDQCPDALKFCVEVKHVSEGWGQLVAVFQGLTATAQVSTSSAIRVDIDLNCEFGGTTHLRLPIECRPTYILSDGSKTGEWTVNASQADFRVEALSEDQFRYSQYINGEIITAFIFRSDVSGDVAISYSINGRRKSKPIKVSALKAKRIFLTHDDQNQGGNYVYGIQGQRYKAYVMLDDDQTQREITQNIATLGSTDNLKFPDEQFGTPRYEIASQTPSIDEFPLSIGFSAGEVIAWLSGNPELRTVAVGLRIKYLGLDSSVLNFQFRPPAVTGLSLGLLDPSLSESVPLGVLPGFYTSVRFEGGAYISGATDAISVVLSSSETQIVPVPVSDAELVIGTYGYRYIAFRKPATVFIHASFRWVIRSGNSSSETVIKQVLRVRTSDATLDSFRLFSETTMQLGQEINASAVATYSDGRTYQLPVCWSASHTGSTLPAQGSGINNCDAAKEQGKQSFAIPILSLSNLVVRAKLVHGAEFEKTISVSLPPERSFSIVGQVPLSGFGYYPLPSYLQKGDAYQNPSRGFSSSCVIRIKAKVGVPAHLSYFYPHIANAEPIPVESMNLEFGDFNDQETVSANGVPKVWISGANVSFNYSTPVNSTPAMTHMMIRIRVGGVTRYAALHYFLEGSCGEVAPVATGIAVHPNKSLIYMSNRYQWVIAPPVWGSATFSDGTTRYFHILNTVGYRTYIRDNPQYGSWYLHPTNWNGGFTLPADVKSEWAGMTSPIVTVTP